MKKQSVLAAMVVLASMITSEAAFAAPLASNSQAFHAPVHAMFSTPKRVSFSVRNDSKDPIKVKAGATEMTLLPGKTAAVKLTVGETIIAQEATSHYAAGTVLVTVISDLSDATVALN